MYGLNPGFLVCDLVRDPVDAADHVWRPWQIKPKRAVNRTRAAAETDQSGQTASTVARTSSPLCGRAGSSEPLEATAAGPGRTRKVKVTQQALQASTWTAQRAPNPPSYDVTTAGDPAHTRC